MHTSSLIRTITISMLALALVSLPVAAFADDELADDATEAVAAVSSDASDEGAEQSSEKGAEATEDDGAATVEETASDEQSADATEEVLDDAEAASDGEDEPVLLGASDGSSIELGDEVSVADGIYQISCSLNSGLIFDVTGGSTSKGARIQLYGDNGTIAQRFRITYDASTGTYTITSVSSGLALDVKGGSQTSGAAVQLWTPNGSLAQQWRFFEGTDGNVVLVSALTTEDGRYLVVDVPGGVAASGRKLQTYTYNGTSAQQWSLEPIGRMVADGIYQLNSGVGGSQVLDVYGGSKCNGANVQTYKANGTPAQWWRVTYDESTGYYTLVNCLSGKALDVYAGKSAKGTNVQIYDVDGSAAQRWSIEESAAGGYVLRSGCGGCVLDVYGGKAANSQNVQVWTGNGTKAQSWTFGTPLQVNYSAGIYQIVPVANMGVCLDVAGASTADGANVRLWSMNNTNAQKWQLGEADSNGWRSIKAAHCSNYLSVNSSGNICMASVDSPGSAQLWKIVPCEIGYQLVSKLDQSKVVDIYGGKVVSGTNVWSYRSNSSDAQRFVLVKTTATVVATAAGTRIMGTSQASKAQMIRYYKSYGVQLPSEWTKDGETIEKIVGYYWDEAKAEGVRADVAFAQTLLETGYFQFGGDVSASQYNFAGLGATGGVPGNSFPSARIGIRAQIQHLKAYASTDPLNQACVDQRFTYVTRGIAPTVQLLSQKWAVSSSYGEAIISILNAILKA